ncbi:hypothetical protein DL95DRAFT_424654 [Leptodontidium sp. 2 PMI_412]|nr:hypothetical protein DL95DRAFT_424654 [Leptodontidium sp. 2 PMI_412]
MATVLLLGSTGLVASSIILNSLSSSAAISSIYTIARRAQVPHTKLTPVAAIPPAPFLFISALAGIKLYVLISAAGTSITSHFAYQKIKAELGEAIKEVRFEKTVFIKPGMIVGTRDNAKPFDGIWWPLEGYWAQDAEFIGRASIVAGLEAVAGDGPAVRNVGHEDIMKLGKHAAAV